MPSEQFKHIQRIRKDFHEGSERLKNSSNNSIRTLADDLYNKHTHFIFELIQNAEDNTYEEHGSYPPYISFRLTKTDPTRTSNSDGALIIQNNELGFNAKNVDAICAVGETTKKKIEGYIGEKGIGFKSVFRVTGNPHIFSNGYHFCLPESDAETGLGYIVPQWVDTLPEGLNLSETYIILPLTKSDFGYEKIEEMLRDIEPEVLLFLSTLEKIRIETDTGDDLTILKDSTLMPEVAVIVEGNKKGQVFSNSDNFLVCTKRFNRPENIYHEKREGIKNRDVSIAFPLSEDSEAVGKIFAYLPVRSDTGFPFLMNADFILPSSREDIQEIPWNHWLMECIANLVVSELLPLLKGRRILNVHFLEALASRLDDLMYDEDSLFYPIFTQVCEALKNEALLPTNDDSFVSAENAVMTRSDAVRSLLTDTQLGMLFGIDVDRDVPLKWLSSEITLDRTPDLRRYIMGSLGVEEVTPDMLARRLSKVFLVAQSDEWFVKFYQFLLDQPALWRSNGGILRTKPILRLQDGTQVNPPQEGALPTAYLSVGGIANVSLPIMKWEISLYEDAYNFLKGLGVQEYDIVAEVIETILWKYENEISTVSIDEHLRDFAKIARAYKTDSREKKAQLRNALCQTPFILAESANPDYPIYLRPDQLYFGTDALRMYFEGNNLISWTKIWEENNDNLAELRQALRSDIPYGPTGAFVNLDIYPTSAQELFSDLGISDAVEIQRKEEDLQRYVTIEKRYGYHRRGLEGFDPGIGVDGLEHALNNPTLEKSAFIWNHIAIPNVDCIKGTVEESTTQTYSNSSSEELVSDHFGHLLVETAWLPDTDGNMQKPGDMILEDLPDSFKKDEQLAKKLNMLPISREQMIGLIAPAIGVPPDILTRMINAPAETIEKIESFLQFSPDSASIALPIPQPASFPVNSVPNPERREKQILSELGKAPDKEYAQKLRSVRTTKGAIDPKTWLSIYYTNDDNQMVCQICQEEMPFKHRSGNYYFDAVEMLKDHFTKEYESQFLALCPECSPKYKTFVKQVPEAMNTLRQRLIDSDKSDDFEIPLKLGDWDTSLRFVERHWLDVKTLLDFYAQQSVLIVEAAEPSEMQQGPQIEQSQPAKKKSTNWDADRLLSKYFTQPVRLITYMGIQDLSEVQTKHYTLKGIDAKGEEVKIAKLRILFAFPKEKMPDLKPYVKIRQSLRSQNLQPIENQKERFHVDDVLLEQARRDKSNVSLVTRTGHVLNGWIQHFDKYVLYMRIGEKVVVVYRHGLFEFTIGEQED